MDDMFNNLSWPLFPGKKDGSDKFDRTQWKAMQQTMSDTPKFVDMLHNVSWEDGLSEDVLRGNFQDSKPYKSVLQLWMSCFLTYIE